MDFGYKGGTVISVVSQLRGYRVIMAVLDEVLGYEPRTETKLHRRLPRAKVQKASTT